MLYSWGANSYGQLSHGLQSEQCISPTEVTLPSAVEGIVSIAAGGGHTIVMDCSGAVYGCGLNNSGQLGDCPDNTTVLTRLEALQEFSTTGIECGWESSYAITDSGSVLALGSNKFGQLGVSKKKVVTTKYPVILEGVSAVQISAGLRHVAVVSSEGHVYTCGQASRGQLGLLIDGKVPEKDVDYLARVEGLENIRQVACGQHHSLALTTDGRLYGWGDNRRGQLTLTEEKMVPSPRLVAMCDPAAVVRAGWTHSAFLQGGTVATWGRNNYNQLGHHSGQDQVNIPQTLADIRGVKQLELGSEHGLALLDNGEVWSWGWNEHGNCGTGTVDNVPVPQKINIPYPSNLIAAGAGHSIALCY